MPSPSERHVDGMDLIERAEQIAASPMDAAQEIEQLTERYAAVRRAYGIEAQERGRLEQQLAGAADVVDAVEHLMRVMDAGSYARPAEPWFALRDALDAYRHV
jgi:hypothetical protein